MMSEQKSSWSLPFFVKVLAIVFIVSVALAGTISLLADRTSKSIAIDGVRLLAQNTTAMVAKKIPGAVKFRKVEDIDLALETLSNGSSDTLQATIVFDLEGTEVTALGNAPTFRSEMAALATQAMETGQAVMSDDALLVVQPIQFGKDSVTVGAIASQWTPGPILERIAVQTRQQYLLGAGILVALLTAMGVVMNAMFSRPLKRLVQRTLDLAEGDFQSEIGDDSRRDEIGDVARSLKTLRTQLREAEKIRAVAAMKSAGYMASSAAMIMADDDMRVTEVNAAFREMATKNLDDIKTAAPAFDLDKIIGTKVDIFHTNPAATRAKMNKLTFPHQTNIDMGETIMSLVINDVKGDDGEPIGYVVEWQEVTDLRKTASILESLEQGLLRADFGPDGRITGANSAFGLSFDQGDPTTAPDRLADIFRLEGEEDGLGEKLKTDAPIVGRFTATVQGTTRILDGSISPVLNARGQVQSHVFLGSDITEAEEALKKSMEETAMLAHEQQSIVDELSTALRHMSNGDLTTRLNTPFKGDYETLRQNFNRTLGALDTAISTIVESASSILSETNTLSRSADDLSRRTEQQAATLEETAAAIAELTASTASAAQGARQASDVVETARSKATASGQVVQSATEAMGKIEESSQQITRIISVIDEIAFQTNLLALNAGVEAARAGDAGRGFAVVASEVRALAQRSSDAAREISNLISTSGDHVKEGVELVGKTGAALSEISVSVQGIAEHVAAIATSANEQSTGLDEINTAMGSLDQVTQQNVAMFEETTAATHTMKGEANSLVKVTGGFQVGSSAAPASPAQPSNSVLKLENAKRPDSTPNGGASQTGNLALVSAPEEDWEEF